MSTTPLTEEQEYTFNVLYGFLFSLSLSNEYIQAMSAIVEDRGSNYVKNKVKESEKANDALLAVIKREFTKTLSDAERGVTLQAIEDQKAFVYKIFMLDADDQKRVKGLINKILKDRL